MSFTDDSGNSESLTSVATADVEAPLTAEIRNVPESHNGQNAFTFRILFSEPVTVGYQGLKEDSFEISNGTITRARRVNGRNDLRQFTVRPSSNLDVVIVLPADRPCDEEGAICTSDGKRLSNRLELTVAGPVPANAPATGAPTISGTAQVGQNLTATTSNIADSDGLVNAVYGYQWVRNDGGTDAEIQGATGATYTIDADDEGKTVKVRVSFTDDAGNEETLTSAGTAAVEARPNSPATGVPTISGTAQVGETLTADTSGIADADGLSNVAYRYQWLAADAEIAGATSSSYALAEADEGKTIRVKVSFTDDAENQESLTSAPTGTVGEPEHATQEQQGESDESESDTTDLGLMIEIAIGHNPVPHGTESPVTISVSNFEDDTSYTLNYDVRTRSGGRANDCNGKGMGGTGISIATYDGYVETLTGRDCGYLCGWRVHGARVLEKRVGKIQKRREARF